MQHTHVHGQRSPLVDAPLASATHKCETARPLTDMCRHPLPLHGNGLFFGGTTSDEGSSGAACKTRIAINTSNPKPRGGRLPPDLQIAIRPTGVWSAASGRGPTGPPPALPPRQPGLGRSRGATAAREEERDGRAPCASNEGWRGDVYGPRPDPR